MKSYVALVRPVSEVENSKVIIPLDEGIFVPRGEMHKECGGILLFENKNYNGGDDFCEKKFGIYAWKERERERERERLYTHYMYLRVLHWTTLDINATFSSNTTL